MNSAGELHEEDTTTYSIFQALINSAQDFIWKVQFVHERRGGKKPVKSLWKQAKGSFSASKHFCVLPIDLRQICLTLHRLVVTPALSSAQGVKDDLKEGFQSRVTGVFIVLFANTWEAFPQHFLTTLFFTSQSLSCGAVDLELWSCWIWVPFGGALPSNGVWQITEHRCWEKGALLTTHPPHPGRNWSAWLLEIWKFC